MLRIRTVFLLLLAAGFFLQQAGQCLAVAEFCVNRKYVATVLCENRNRPGMHCNGKCHLRKQLDRTADKQNEKQRSGETVIAWENFTPATTRRDVAESPALFPVSPEKPYSTRFPSLFRPPCL